MITVTAATGKLGTLVIEQLLEKVPAAQVRVAVRDPEKAANWAAIGIDVRRADYTEPASLSQALDGTDKLLLISTNDPGQALRQHTNVIDAAKQVGVGLLAYTSTAQVRTPVRSTEQVVVDSALPFVLLRNGIYTDHFAPQIKQAVATGVLVASVGEARVASATQADLAAATVEVLTESGHQNRTYELTGDTAWTFSDLAAHISAASGRAIEYRNVSSEAYRDMLLAAGRPQQVVDVLVGIYQGIADGEFETATTELRDLIGRPTTPIAETVAKIVNS